MNTNTFGSKKRFLTLIIAICAVLAASCNVMAKKRVEDGIVAPAQSTTSPNSAVRKPSICGGMEFDRASGRMIPRPNIDLVVKHLEIINTDSGTWVKPTIRNNCPGTISGNIHVSIGDVVVTYAGLPPKTNVKLGYAVGVAPSASYTATVDYDHRIRESNERNNRCTRSTSGNCN